VIIIETAWVLSAYELTQSEILSTLESVAADGRFQIEHGSLLTEAIQRTRKKGDLPEHVASIVARRSGAKKTQTFDRAVRLFPVPRAQAARHRGEGEPWQCGG